MQAQQYDISVAACCALAHVFTDAGYDVAIRDVLEPGPFERHWRPRLQTLDWRLVVVLPSIEETLARSKSREKHVLEDHTRRQHAALRRWPDDACVDTSGLTVEQSLALVAEKLGR